MYCRRTCSCDRWVALSPTITSNTISRKEMYVYWWLFDHISFHIVLSPKAFSGRKEEESGRRLKRGSGRWPSSPAYENITVILIIKNFSLCSLVSCVQLHFLSVRRTARSLCARVWKWERKEGRGRDCERKVERSCRTFRFLCIWLFDWI